MHLLLADMCLGSGDHERAIQLFERARALLNNRTIQHQPPLVVSLVDPFHFLATTQVWIVA